MRRIALLAAVAFTAVACQKPFEERVTGNWSGPNGSTFTIDKAKTYSATASFQGKAVKIAGDWTASGEKITMTPKTVNGQPVEGILRMVKQMAPALHLSKDQLDKINSGTGPTTYAMGSDGKTLTSEGPNKGITMTKQD